MSSKKKDDPLLEPLLELSSKLDTLIRLTALGLVKDLGKQRQQIELLSDAGFPPKQIADVLRTTRNTVSVALNSIKKERTSKEKSEVAEETETSAEAQVEGQDNEEAGF